MSCPIACTFLRNTLFVSDGYFIYLQASEASSGAVAHLQSPVCSANGPHCFRFWYHMYGVARTMALRVYVAEDAAPRLVWSETGNKGDRWNLAEVTVYSGGNMQVGEIICLDSHDDRALMKNKWV